MSVFCFKTFKRLLTVELSWPGLSNLIGRAPSPPAISTKEEPVPSGLASATVSSFEDDRVIVSLAICPRYYAASFHALIRKAGVHFIYLLLLPPYSPLATAHVRSVNPINFPCNLANFALLCPSQRSKALRPRCKSGGTWMWTLKIQQKFLCYYT